MTINPKTVTALRGAMKNRHAADEVTSVLNAVAALGGAEAAVIDGVVAGTQAAGKAIVVDSNVNQGVAKVTALHIGTSGSETQVTATAAEINQHCDESTRVEVVTETNVITASESGKTFFLDAVAGFLSTLPAPAAGLEYTFIVKTAPTSNGYTIATNAGADIIVITVNELETDTGDDGPSDDNADLITFVANVALQGDRIDFKCDGTNWYAMGQTIADGAVTTATT